MVVLLLSCYELGHQPLSLAWPLAFLQPQPVEVHIGDLAVQPFDAALAARANFIGLAVPMHTALRIGVAAARRARALNPSAHICFFGLYAWLNQDYLLAEVADSIIGGESESALAELIRAVQMGDRRPESIPGVSTRTQRAQPILTRLAFPAPHRAPLPPLTHYARYSHSNSLSNSDLSGYVEASRGCRHTCRHCPLVPLYNGRFFAVPEAVVLADIRQQVASGARHITFGDPDFLNGPTHALRLTRALRREFPTLTFDFTTKVEHILRHRALFPELAKLGGVFVTSAIESLSDPVLQKLAKGHTAADVDTALAILDSAAIALRPTLVAFTPWTTLADYLNQIEWIRARDLAEHIPPIQLTIRLLVPPRSALLALPDATQWLGPLDPANFVYQWAHPDPRMDALHRQVLEVVEAATAIDQPFRLTHAAIRSAAYAAAGHPAAPVGPAAHRRRPAPPRLTENWFC